MITLDVLPDTETIHNFIHGTVLPNECFQMTGIIEINITRPVQIKQLQVRFQGKIDCVLSTLDFHDNLRRGDEVPMEQWNTNESKRLMDKITRTALGQSNVHYTLVDEYAVLVNETHCLPMGKSSLPFCLKINNVHCLPASIFLPHHLIRYELSATMKLDSISEKLKLTFRNPLQKPIKTSKVKIEIYNHTYPSIHLVDLSRIRYRGSRKDCLKYEISMPKFTCLQKKMYGFTCQFNSFHLDSKIQSFEFYLEQTESYP